LLISGTPKSTKSKTAMVPTPSKRVGIIKQTDIAQLVGPQMFENRSKQQDISPDITAMSS